MLKSAGFPTLCNVKSQKLCNCCLLVKLRSTSLSPVLYTIISVQFTVVLLFEHQTLFGLELSSSGTKQLNQKYKCNVEKIPSHTPKIIHLPLSCTVIFVFYVALCCVSLLFLIHPLFFLECINLKLIPFDKVKYLNWAPILLQHNLSTNQRSNVSSQQTIWHCKR